jgi:hypothetical protein
MRETVPFSPKNVLALLSAMPAFLKRQGEPLIAGDAGYAIALERIMEALPPTQLYVAQLSRGEKENRTTEEALANLWYQAAKRCAPFDAVLADHCSMKGAHWTQRVLWNEDMVSEARTGLEQIHEQLRQLLLDRKFKP